MPTNLDRMLQKMKTGKGCDADEIRKHLADDLPGDYLEFVEKYNGATGFLGDFYLDLFSLNLLVKFNSDDSYLREIVPGLFLIGSDGGGTGFAYIFENNSDKIFELPLILVGREEMKFVSDDFEGFLIYFIKKFNR